MKLLNPQSWSERQQVVAIILMAGALIFGLWFGPLTILSRERRRLQASIDRKTKELQSRNLMHDEATLQTAKGKEDSHNRLLHGEWVTMCLRVAGFTPEDSHPEKTFEHIDYKVALYDVRQRLTAKSRDLKISLPRGLGLPDTIGSTEDPQTLMLQLRALERLVDLALDLKIHMVREIKPLAPVTHETGADNEVYVEEYPVRIEFEGNLQNVYDLFQAVLQDEHVFALRHIKLEPLARDRADMLVVTAELSALAFVKDPDDITMGAGPPIKRKRPKGV